MGQSIDLGSHFGVDGLDMLCPVEFQWIDFSGHPSGSEAGGCVLLLGSASNMQLPLL